MVRITSLVVLTLLLLALLSVEGRGGGGKGGGGKSGGGGKGRGGSRSSGSRSTSSGARVYKGPVFKSRSSWKSAAAVSTLYGVSSYKSRMLYKFNPDKEPTVCFNEKVLRGGTYGYFICPEPSLPDDKAFCCGGDGEQKCCTEAEFKRQSLIVTIVFVVVSCIIIGIIAICVIMCWRRKSARKHAALKDKAADHATVQYQTAPQSKN